MTAIAEFTDETHAGPVPVRMADGGRMIIRGAQRLMGAALALAALGLWFAPGASWESDIMLFKLVLSLSAVLAGLALMHASSTPRTPEVEIDTIRRVVRVVRRQRGGAPVVLQSCGFGQLERAEMDGSLVRLWDQAGRFLAEVTLSDRVMQTSLIAGLRDAGKLA